MYAAIQFQRDASLMSPNLTVLHQYAIVMHWTSIEVLHYVFGREFFPSGAVNDAAPFFSCYTMSHTCCCWGGGGVLTGGREGSPW